MSDGAARPSRPLLHPVLVLRKKAAERDALGGGKKESDIVSSRLVTQRRVLSDQVRGLIRESKDLKLFAGDVILIAEMFDDSFAVSRTPRDLFTGPYGISLRGAARDGYFA